MNISTVLLALALFVATQFTAYAQQQFSRDAGVAEICRLSEGQRWADAVALAEQLKQQYPGDSAVLEAHGAVALLVGATKPAHEDFKTVVQTVPSSYASYGLGLSQMISGLNGDALKSFRLAAEQDGESGQMASEIRDANAVCFASRSAFEAALAVCGTTDSPVSAEVRAFYSPATVNDRIAALQAVLNAGMINGVPRVVEPNGIRTAMTGTGCTLEPSVEDPETIASLSNRFTLSSQHPFEKGVSGVFALIPPRPVVPGTSLVTVSLDGQVIGISNSAPFSLTWDSSSVSNGSHSLIFAMSGTNGSIVGNEKEDIYVTNSSELLHPGNPLPRPTLARLWQLLLIQPSYSSVEYALALDDLAENNHSEYETHILRCAALNPDYKDVRIRIHPLFSGVAPTTFPVPDGTKLPSTLGLSAGSATAAGFWAGSPHIREMALTFDDGPIPEPNRRLLAALTAANAHATFFVVGIRAVQSPESLRLMAADGDDVEDHSYTHPNLAQVLPRHVVQEILRTAVVIQATTGKWPHFLRPPGGNTSPLVLETARACGMSGAFWTIDALPAEEGGSPDAVAKWVINRARPGAIVLMHNGMDATIASIPKLVSGLRHLGYALVTIRQLASDALATKHDNT